MQANIHQARVQPSKLHQKNRTSKYYAPQTEYEIYVKHPRMDKMLEIGDAGFYSPVPLAKYKIAHPVWTSASDSNACR